MLEIQQYGLAVRMVFVLGYKKVFLVAEGFRYGVFKLAVNDVRHFCGIVANPVESVGRAASRPSEIRVVCGNPGVLLLCEQVVRNPWSVRSLDTD